MPSKGVLIKWRTVLRITQGEELNINLKLIPGDANRGYHQRLFLGDGNILYMAAEPGASF